MVSSTSIEQRSWLQRATKTGAPQRVREHAGLSRADCARRFHVDGATFYRWELGQTVPTHGPSLSNYVRWLKRLGIDDDPAMKDMGECGSEPVPESAEVA
jgi:transcriptional regulator with XRE-family HTH domain